MGSLVFLSLGVLAASLPFVSCGIAFRSGAQPEPAKAVGLDAFKKEIGLEVHGRKRARGKRGPVSAEERKQWILDQENARKLLDSIRKEEGYLVLENLPAGPTRPERLALAEGLLAIGRPQEAKDNYVEMLQEDLRYFPALLGLAQAQAATEEFENAQEFYEDYLEYRKDDEDALAGLALVLLYGKKDPDKGLRLLEQVVRSSKRPGFFAQKCALWCHKVSRHEDAKRILLLARERGDQSLESAFLLGRSYRRLGKFEDARKELQSIVDRPWNSQGLVLYELIHIERELGHFDQAWKYYERLARGDFRSLREQIGAQAFARLGQYIQNEKAAGRRVTKRPEELLDALFTEKDPLARAANMMNLEKGALLRGIIKPELWNATMLKLAKKDPDWRIRLQAIQQHFKYARGDKSAVWIGLADSDPRVRSTAASALLVSGQREHAASLFRAMEKEGNPMTFRRFHSVLQRLSGKSVDLPRGAEKDRKGRREVVVAWAKALSLPLLQKDETLQKNETKPRKEAQEAPKKEQSR